MQRRTFIRHTALVTGGALATTALPALTLMRPFQLPVTNRPPLEKRTFTSESVEKTITAVKSAIANQELAWMFENCFPNTLDTTVQFEWRNNQPDTFIITGDIDAMWLRDSTAQVWPYLPLMPEDQHLQHLVAGLIRRQAQCVLLDPYANAFYKNPEKVSEWISDQPTPVPGVHERKWEIDSLCYVVRLAYGYYTITGDNTPLDAAWNEAMRLVVQTLRTEQRKNLESPYYFIRTTNNMIDAPVFRGTGAPIRPVGLIASMFRPSDDATVLPFLIPSNLFAVMALRQLAFLYRTARPDEAFAAECAAFAGEVEKAVASFGVARHLKYGKIFAYEVDGFGNQLFQDDANVPSLMSLAYLDPAFAKNPVYRRTRKFLLSEYNPYFLKGKVAEGQGSPHTGKSHIWPMGIILRALTSTSQEEITSCLRMLLRSHAGTGFMHESFDKDNANNYTRSWFAWANTLFGELIFKIYKENKEILKND